MKPSKLGSPLCTVERPEKRRNRHGSWLPGGCPQKSSQTVNLALGTKVIDDPTKNLKVVAVMFKREKGYDPDNQYWLYTEFGPDGIPQKNKKGVFMTGRAGKCIGCHKSAPGGDYIYSFDR